MKTKVMSFGIMLVLFLLVSTVTIVPQTQSKPIMDKVDEIEKNRYLIEKTSDILNTGVLNGFFEWLIQVILLLIELVQQIQRVINSILGIINQIISLPAMLSELFQTIIDFISLLINGPQNNIVV